MTIDPNAAPTAMQPEDGLTPIGYLFRLRYGPDRWSEQLMYSIALPKEGDYKEVQPLVRHSEAAAIITSLRAENARLTKERDAALDNDWVAAPAYAAKVEQCRMHRARATTLQARLDAAVEALNNIHELNMAGADERGHT